MGMPLRHTIRARQPGTHAATSPCTGVENRLDLIRRREARLVTRTAVSATASPRGRRRMCVGVLGSPHPRSSASQTASPSCAPRSTAPAQCTTQTATPVGVPAR